MSSGYLTYTDMEDKIDLTNSFFYIKMDINPDQTLRVFEKMGIDLDRLSENEWFKKDFLGHRNINEDNTLLVSGNQILNISKGSGYEPVDFDSLSNNQSQKETPLYNMSDIERHYKEIDKNSCACYFLEPGKDKRALDKIKSLGYDQITSLTNDGISLKKKDVFLIIENKAYIHPNPDDDRFRKTCPEMIDLLAPTGISDIQNIPRYKLDDFLKQEKEDIEALNEHFLFSIPINRRTQAVCLKALNDHPSNMEDIPNYLFTDKRIEQILDMNNSFIADLPKEKLNEEICLNAVEKESLTFSWIPQELKTEKVCMAAYERARMETDDPAYLGSIVEKIPHSSVCMDLLDKYAYSNSGEFHHILTAIQENVMNRDIAELAVKLQEYAILDIPEKLISEKMYETALSIDESLIFKVPDRYKTFELCHEILANAPDDGLRPLLFSSIPYPQLIMEALQSKVYENCPVLDIAKNIPKEVMNHQIAEELIKRDVNCLQYIPFHLKDENICLKAIRGTEIIDPLYSIPRDSMTNKVCTELTNKFPQALGYILPEEKRTPEICLRAVIQYPSLEKFVPEHIQNSKDINIYRFGVLAVKQLPKLKFDQIKDLYRGKKIAIDYTIPENQLSRRLHVQYNSQNKSLEYSDIPLAKKESTSPELNLNKSKGIKF